MMDLSENPTELSQDNIHFGESLKQERLRQGLSIEAISEGTGINTANLLALEEGARRKLPADVFNRGFIKLYANFLQIDPKKSLDNYEMEWGFTNGIDGATVYLAGGEMAEPASILEDKQALAFIGIVVLVAAIFLAFQFFHPFWSKNNNQQQPPYSSLTAPKKTPVVQKNHTIERDTPEQENIDHENLYSTYEGYLVEDNETETDRETGPVPEQTISPGIPKLLEDALPELFPGNVLEETKPTITETIKRVNNYTLVANFSERTWLKITIDQDAPSEYTFRANEKHTWRATETFNLLIGNAGGLELFMDGKKINLNKGKGQVISLKLPLNN